MGTLVFQATLGGAVNIIGPNIANTINFTLPSADGTSGQTWTTNGSGVLAFGTLGIAGGGTGQITATAAFNALAPSQSGQSGKYLTTDGTNTSWGTNPLGTVTSVAATVPSFLSIAGSPITTSGTLAFTLSGTALPTTSGGTGLTSFTSGGVVYASSTSALATGSALTFDGTTLGVSASAPYVRSTSTAGSQTHGFTFYEAATQLGFMEIDKNVGNLRIGTSINWATVFYTNNAEQMRLTSTGLGIGTSSVTSGVKLEVLGGNVRFTNTNNTASSNTTFWNGDYAGLFIRNLSNTSGTVAGLHFVNGSSANGNAGIGGVAEDTNPSLSALAFYTGGSGVSNTVPERLRITSAGNVGIGTSSPTEKLQVTGTADVKVILDSTAGAYTSTLELKAAGGGGSVVAALGGSNNLILRTNGVDRVNLDSSGNLLVGTTSTSRAGVLSVQAAVSKSGISINMAHATADQFNCMSMRRTASTGAFIEFVNQADTANVGSITTDNSTIALTNVSGITFPATQSASSDANTLDDYEEGTWTPSQGGGLTVVGTFSSSGTYTKIGRFVYVKGSVNGSTSIAVAAGSIITGNLPFSAANQGTGTAVNAPFNVGSVAAINALDFWSMSAIGASGGIVFSGSYAV